MEKRTAKPKNAYIESLVSRMTLDQKIGAVLTLAFTGIIPEKKAYQYINEYHCGGLRLTPVAKAGSTIQYIDPKTGATATKSGGHTMAPVCTVSDYKAALDTLRKVARQRPLSLPLHLSFDQEGGTASNFYFAHTFSYPMGLRATNDPKLVYHVGRAIAEQARAIGGHWIHSPDVDINCDPRNPEIGVRAYSDNAEDVATFAAEMCRGLKDGGVIATAKHFPGRGASTVDAHFEVPTIDVDKETLWNRELLPYRRLIEQDLLPCIMIAHSIYPAIDPDNVATVSKPIITGLLREELGFEGVITTDSMTMGGIRNRYGVANACAMALEAGADLVLMKAQNELVEETIAAIRSFVEQGRITMEELDQKVYRILNLKYEYGLFHDYDQDDSDPEKLLKSSRFIQLAKDVAKRSVLIGRDEDKLLPLKPEEKVLIIEQNNDIYNTPRWHSGMLYEDCLQYSHNITLLETGFSWSEDDVNTIKNSLNSYDKVVITNYYRRDVLTNLDKIIDVLDTTDKKEIIVITDTPYEEISVPHNAKNVIVTFAPTPDAAEAIAGVLYGKINPEGVWPVAHHA